MNIDDKLEKAMRLSIEAKEREGEGYQIIQADSGPLDAGFDYEKRRNDTWFAEEDDRKERRQRRSDADDTPLHEERE